LPQSVPTAGAYIENGLNTISQECKLAGSIAILPGQLRERFTRTLPLHMLFAECRHCTLPCSWVVYSYSACTMMFLGGLTRVMVAPLLSVRVWRRHSQFSRLHVCGEWPDSDQTFFPSAATFSFVTAHTRCCRFTRFCHEYRPTKAGPGDYFVSRPMLCTAEQPDPKTAYSFNVTVCKPTPSKLVVEVCVFSGPLWAGPEPSRMRLVHYESARSSDGRAVLCRWSTQGA
jgi:hypothetical protein